MPTPDEVMATYIALWNAIDPAERRSLSEQVLTEDVAISYPTMHARGREEIVAGIGALQQHFPGARFQPISGIEQHHGWLRECWRLVDTDGKVLSEGEDVAERGEDGRLRRVIGFHNPLPPLS